MQLEKAYKPKDFETSIYQKWEQSGAFKPVDRGRHEPFAIIMPPPNANGQLHAGHAIGYTLTDVIIRYKRMQGHKTLWLPGTDHAGIETQFVFERDVLAPAGKSRFDLGPEQFYADVMKFTRAAENSILDQMRAMGFSADWQSKKFTLDEDVVDIVYDTFAKLHKDGHIYRGNRIVNWCTRCNAAFADIELDYQEREDKMYTLDYGTIKIATTRPETIFADVAVAVNPKDSRFKALVGKEAVVPLVDRPVPIITDVYVDPDAGTGALKVTPGHDPNDYEIGLRHQLPTVSVIDPNGQLINVPEQFAGMSVGEGRTAVVAALIKAGKLSSEQPIKHAVAVHDRCDTVIEPLLSEQWFLRIKDLNQPVIAALKSGDVKIFPARYTKIALNWLEQEHDWCISRQIWWGIRIPVFYKTSNDPKKDPYLIAKNEAAAQTYYGAGNYRAETDTFDTWFSSGQWPFATLMTTGNFNEFYPTQLMGTAREILHKWVTRMIMFGLYRTQQVPFKDVYLWGLVTDEKGQKMSKSKGNVVDPLAMTGQYGTDALRLAGAMANTPGTDSPLSESQVIAQRNFVNKLWNVARYILGKVGDDKSRAEAKAETLADRWLLDCLAGATTEISQKLDSYRLNEAANRLYHLLWNDFADWYLEASKVESNSQMLAYGLQIILKLAHPFVPFVTEAIWSQLPGSKDQLIISPWPSVNERDADAATQFSKLQALVTEIRTLRAEMNLPPVALYHRGSKLLSEQTNLITKLAGLTDISQVETGEGLPLVTLGEEAWLGVDHETVQAYKQRLAEQLSKAESYAEQLSRQLANPQFMKSAPEVVVTNTKSRYQAAQKQVMFIQNQLVKLKNV